MCRGLTRPRRSPGACRAFLFARRLTYTLVSLWSGHSLFEGLGPPHQDKPSLDRYALEAMLGVGLSGCPAAGLTGPLASVPHPHSSARLISRTQQPVCLR